MAENSGTDPAVETNTEENAAASATIIKVTVKTPKDKEEIAIAEDSSVAQVIFSRFLVVCITRAFVTPAANLNSFSRRAND